MAGVRCIGSPGVNPQPSPALILYNLSKEPGLGCTPLVSLALFTLHCVPSLNPRLTVTREPPGLLSGHLSPLLTPRALYVVTALSPVLTLECW